MRGGRFEDEYIGNTYDIGLHHVLGAIHGMVGAPPNVMEDPATKWKEMGGKAFD